MDKNNLKVPTAMVAFRTTIVLFFALAVSILLATSVRAEDFRFFERPKDIEVKGLVDHRGEAFEFSALQGRVVFVVFGFTHCPDICPATLQRLRTLDASLDGRLKNSAFVMISVDGERDTVPVMNDYLSGFSSRFIGVTGDSDVVGAAAVQFQAAYFKGISSTGDDKYVVSHSPQIFLLDTEGRLRGEFHDASIDMMQSVTVALSHERKNLQAGVRK